MAILFTMLAGLLVASCAGSRTERASCDSSYPTRSGVGGSYKYQNATGVLPYTVTSEMSTTRLRLIFEQTEGSVSWKFTGPAGEVQWEGEYGQAGTFDEARDFEPVEGTWNLEIDSQNGAGKYDLCWMAK